MAALRRRYSRRLRDLQERLTRNRIMESVAEFVYAGRIHNFSVQEVAERAGVSYGSVYRHFPTREALLEELFSWSRETGGAPGIGYPRTLDDVPAFARMMVEISERNSEYALAALMATTGMGLHPQAQRKDDAAFHRLVATAAPHLDPGVIRCRAAIIRYVASSLCWATLKQRFGLNAAEIGEAVTWALETLVREARSEPRPAAGGAEKEETP